jgi:hypothetical protein
MIIMVIMVIEIIKIIVNAINMQVELGQAIYQTLSLIKIELIK